MNQTKKGKEFSYWFRDIKRESYVKECFHNDSQCSSQIISAHSIQNNRILNKIAENGKVLCYSKNDKEQEGDLTFTLSPVGRSKATTFTGFCSNHDNKIFTPIELNNYQEGNEEQEFLFAYRALAQSYHARKRAIRLVQALKNKVGNSNPVIDIYLEASQCTLSQLERDKNSFNLALDNKKFDIVGTRVMKFQQEYHVAVSSAFTMKNDINGKTINDYSNLNIDLKHLYLTIFPQDGKTFILFSYLKKYKKYLSSTIDYISKSTVYDRKIIISNLIAIHIENLALSPIRWDLMSESDKENFQKLFNQTIRDDGDSLR
jgi:hypothetical protein